MKIERYIKSDGILNAKNLIKLNDYFVGYFIGTLAKIILQDIHLKLNDIYKLSYIDMIE